MTPTTLPSSITTYRFVIFALIPVRSPIRAIAVVYALRQHRISRLTDVAMTMRTEQEKKVRKERVPPQHTSAPSAVRAFTQSPA